MGTPRPVPTGRADSLGRGVRVAALDNDSRASAPTPGGRVADLLDLPPVAAALLAALNAAGGRPLFVGGSVRDALAARIHGDTITAKDLDVEVYGQPLDVLADALDQAGFRVDLVGRQFGVLKAARGGVDFDVSIPRSDSKVGSGHRGFSVRPDPNLDFAAAAGRRDFTINSIMWDPVTGELIDPHGGIGDLAAGILRHTSPAFADDPLRVLRAVQFAGRFGHQVHPDTLELCRRLAGSYDELPAERVWGEWSKIATMAAHPSRALDTLHAAGWEQHHPQLAAVRGVAQDPRWHPEGTVEVHTGEAADVAAAIAVRDGLDADDRQTLVLAAVCHDFGKATHTQHQADGRITSRGHAEAGVEPALAFLAGIGATGRTPEKVAVLVAEHMCAATPDGPTAKNVRRLARRLDVAGVPLEMWAKVVEADNRGRGSGSHPGPAGDWVRLAREIAVDQRPAKPLLTGRDLIALGMRPGPDMGRVLTAAQQAQDDGVFDDQNSAVDWARRQLGGQQ